MTTDERANRAEDAATGLDPERTTVHGALRRVAGAEAVFRRHGIDTCCGGELPLAEAAAAHDVDPERLLRELEEAGERG